MEIPQFKTQEEALKWGQDFITGLERGVAMFTEQEAGQGAATTENIPGSFSQNDYMISRIEQISAVIATTRHTLSALIPKLRTFPEVDHEHIQPLSASVFMLDTVERELDEINLFLMPIDEVHNAARAMAAMAKKANKNK